MKRDTALKDLREFLMATESATNIATTLKSCFPEEYEPLKNAQGGDKLIEKMATALIGRIAALFPVNDSWFMDLLLFEGVMPDLIPVASVGLEWWEWAPDPLCVAILEGLRVNEDACEFHSQPEHQGEPCQFAHTGRVNFRKLRVVAADARLTALEAAVKIVQHDSGNWWVDVTIEELDRGGDPQWDRPTIDWLAARWKEAKRDFFEPYQNLLKTVKKSKRKLALVTRIIKQCRTDA